MNEKKAKKLLDDTIGYVRIWPSYDHATLDGEFTADELEAIAWWMKNKKENIDGYKGSGRHNQQSLP